MDAFITTPSIIYWAFEELNKEGQVNFFRSENENNPGAHVASFLTGMVLGILGVLEFVFRVIAAPFVLLAQYIMEKTDKSVSFDSDNFNKKIQQFGESLNSSFLDGVVGSFVYPALALGS